MGWKMVYSSHGKLSALSFHNLVMTMCVNSDFERVNEFVSKWAPRVNAIVNRSHLALASAQNCFYHQRFKKSYVIPGGLILNFSQKSWHSVCTV